MNKKRNRKKRKSMRPLFDISSFLIIIKFLFFMIIIHNHRMNLITIACTKDDVPMKSHYFILIEANGNCNVTKICTALPIIIIIYIFIIIYFLNIYLMLPILHRYFNGRTICYLLIMLYF